MLYNLKIVGLGWFGYVWVGVEDHPVTTWVCFEVRDMCFVFLRTLRIQDSK